MITIIDYKTGNLGSIQNILKKIGEESIITSDKNEIANAKKLILPGVGAFDTGMGNLNKLDLVDILNYKVLVEKTPVLRHLPGNANIIQKQRRRILTWFGMDKCGNQTF